MADSRVRAAWCWIAFCAVLPQVAWGDQFTYTDQSGKSETITAKLVASGQGLHILSLADGQYKLIPQAAVQKREVNDEPQPLTADELAADLSRRFGPEKFRSHVEKPFVMGLVLASPLAKSSESRAAALLKKGGRFMSSVADAFISFVKDARIDVAQPEFPLVVLIFETDSDFEVYANEATGGKALSAGNISGFYSGLTNFLAIRLCECNTFDVPMHEAIHQQVYNRNVFQRFSPVPHWFDEGIATGFETNNGRITVSPVKVSARYAKAALGRNDFDWVTMATDDRVFMGDVLAGEAYGQAWGLHWLMVTKYRPEYGKYVRLLSGKEPLQADGPEQRVKDFEAAFGKKMKALEKEFEPALTAAIKRQKLVLDQAKTPGLSLTNDGLGRVEMSAVNLVDVGALQVEGKLTNLSPIRAMSFHVTVETNNGMYAEWFVPDLGMSKNISLNSQFVSKVMENGGVGGGSRTFRVKIRSAPSGSTDADNWRKGNLPVPQFRG